MSTTYRLRAERLREAAAKLGDHTSYAIAKRTGLAQSTIGRLRQGVVRPTTGSLIVLANAYGLTVDDLVEHEIPVKESA